MSSIFLHHGKLWVRIRGLKEPGKWGRKRTDYVAGQEELAARYATVAQRHIDKRWSDGAGGLPTRDTSVDDYAAWYFKGREGRIEGVVTERARYLRYISPHIGGMKLGDVASANVRDMVRSHRKLVKTKELAPRTARALYGIARCMFRDAVVEQRIMISPAGKDHLGTGELPPVIDKDGEWRSEATYEPWEVLRLISDPEVPPDRRVQYALKALAGLRHSDMNVCRWRNYKHQKEPLGQLVVVTPKTGVTRLVPVHPVLAKILAVWKLSLWAQVYGRPPTDDDLIVPTRALTPPDNRQACAAFQRDLVTLGLRQEAGSYRNRGGHDLRSWFISTCQEHGAHRDLLQVVTHTKRKQVMDGYTRASWGSLCAEVAKLRITLPEGEVLALSTTLGEKKYPTGGRRVSVGASVPFSTSRGTRQINAGIRWAPERRRADRRFAQEAATAQSGALTSDDRSGAAQRSALERAELVSRRGTDLATAVLAGDQVTARRLALELAEPAAAGTEPSQARAHR